ncbi:two-component system response regulator [Paenibacillus sp. 32O-W]|uniref:response regulator transcription factor n=1 Tax=Paenibacillus sp. 32O-W TaxID=1695218 RepID=UPI000720A1CD|nr:response regulator transcription factor [Paenibacillus sp. 32O-W]ALS27948.1 two-component system response regulator [Paenibacillus sp. 32O-W]
MYNVLLVDDERIILDGISHIVDWRLHGTALAGTARNGVEALLMIEADKPDIVITDIRMPGMDGLQLVEKAAEQYPDIAFIMLSGFDEFDYARRAMSYGVKHYLLKPCNEAVIGQALNEVKEELDRRRSREQFLRNMETELMKVLPHAKEQFLKELVTNKTYRRSDWDDYGQLFGMPIEIQQVRLLLIQLEGMYDYEHLFAFKNIAEYELGHDVLLLSTTIGKHVLLLVKEPPVPEKLFAQIVSVKHKFVELYKIDATIAISEAGDITGVRHMYRETQECLNYRFYLGEGSIITKRDIARDDAGTRANFTIDEERLCMMIRSGDWADVEAELDAVFESLADMRMDMAMAKSYLIPLFVAIARQSGDAGEMNRYLQSIARMDSFQTLQSLRSFITETARNITSDNYKALRNRHSTIIGKMIGVIEENLGNPELSLNWVANEILYMNADYLGKLFKKETGEKFSHYVMKARIRKATDILERTDDVKVFELAEMLGFGDNPQYFSQVFKKYTGCTPSEYKRSP